MTQYYLIDKESMDAVREALKTLDAGVPTRFGSLCSSSIALLGQCKRVEVVGAKWAGCLWDLNDMYPWKLSEGIPLYAEVAKQEDGK